MSIDRYHAHQEAQTDPFLRKITDADLEREEAARGAALPPLARPRVPRLDDDSVAELIAELDEDETAAPRPAAAQTDARDTAPSRSRPVPRPAPAPAPTVPRPRVTADRPAPPPLRAVPPRVPEAGFVAPVDDGDEEPEEQFGPEDDPSVLRLSGDGPVLRSRYGDFRPPVAVGRRRKGQRRAPDPTSLTGLSLTSRSTGRIGSRLFTLFFLAIFLLILAEVVIGLVSAAAGP